MSGLKALKEKPAKAKTDDKGGAGVVYELLAPVRATESADTQRCAKLEARLAKIEKMIGSEKDSYERESLPLQALLMH